MHKYIDWRNLISILVVIVCSFLILGCAGKRVKIDSNDPVERYKQGFLERYGFFVTNKEIVSYYQDVLGIVGKEKEIFENLKTIGDVDKFTEVFLKVRDYDPNTPENEFKDEKDQRIQDIKNEIFSADPDIPLTRFDRNGGLKGDLAHVYLLYGTPHFKAKLSQDTYHVELMVWYYFDVQGKPIFKFLFYDNYGSVRLFKKHILGRPDDLFDPLMSPLKEISDRFINTPEELYGVWRELELQDPERVFIGALLQFSYYSDVIIEGGNDKRLGALDPPRPAALTAAKFKPTISGQPDDLTGREFFNSVYHSFIPAELEITKNNRPSFTLKAGYTAVDWEVKGDNAEFVLDLRISFQNKVTRSMKEFAVRFSKIKPRDEVETKRKSAKINGVKIPIVMNIPLDNLPNFARPEEPRQTLHQLIDGLEPGDYIVNVDLRHPVTKKSAGGWREEIMIK